MVKNIWLRVGYIKNIDYNSLRFGLMMTVWKEEENEEEWVNDPCNYCEPRTFSKCRHKDDVLTCEKKQRYFRWLKDDLGILTRKKKIYPCFAGMGAQF